MSILRAVPDAAGPLPDLEQDFAVVPTGAALGADITGLDLSRPLGPATFQRLVEAWSRHLVLRFRGQALDDGALIGFSQRFGVLDRAPIHAAGTKTYPDPYILIVSNIVEDGLRLGSLGAYESAWHIDMSYNDVPPVGSILYGVEVPAVGGDTSFINLGLAYETLPAELKAAIAGRTATHDSSRNSAGELRRGFAEVTDPREAPGARHPLALPHPVTGRPMLYLGRRRNAYVQGLDLAESEALLDALWAHAEKPEHVWTQKWQVGDVVLWDNFATAHRRDSFDGDARRYMKRTQIKARA
ncbi:TauD/TfdA dioxygenase family protein [Zavarzinia sp. CC-PAN008]|uniref:TauD/TfdA dioxygenase family protein n=1 Tax=Zavarzinia sp. CC-PAN008 TaxID=3243332 RepID=UPI003F742FAD